VYWGAVQLGLPESACLVVTLSFTIGLRFWAMARNISLPKAPKVPV
ncbi:MAG: hypothetical protein ACI84D_001291, partial [Thalassolituus oleivorans]